MISRELKKGSTEILILSLLEDQPRHGYEIGKLIDARSEGVLKLNAASLYPILYRLEKRRWIKGGWESKDTKRRRRYYRLTASGRKVLEKQRRSWHSFVDAIDKVAGISRSRHAELD